MAKTKRPRVPAHFFERDLRAATLMTATRLATFVTGALLTGYVYSSSLHWVLKTPFLIVTALLGAIGLHGLALVGHEGTHFNLHANRFKSALWGVLTASLVPLHFDMGFAVGHARHHRYTNKEKDPDLDVFAGFTGFLARTLLARSAASRQYLADTVRLGLSLPIPNLEGAINLSKEQLRLLARINLGTAAVVWSCYGLLIYWKTSFFLPALGLSLLGAFFLSGIRPYLEHAGTDAESRTNARTWTPPGAGFIFGNINYHHAHHLYPAVPAYRMPEFQEWLVANGYIGSDAVQARRWRDLIPVIGRQEYGERQTAAQAPVMAAKPLA